MLLPGFLPGDLLCYRGAQCRAAIHSAAQKMMEPSCPEPGAGVLKALPGKRFSISAWGDRNSELLGVLLAGGC